MKRLILVSLSLLLFVAVQAQKKGDGVYVMGVSYSFSDSIAYFTEVQFMDSVALEKKTKFLPKRDIYSEELQTYMAIQENKPNRTSIVIFAKNKNKIKKREAKLKKRLENKRGLTVRYLGDKFHFTRP